MKWLLSSLIIFSTTLHAGQSWQSYKKETLSHQEEVWGWCTNEKAEKLMNLIHDTNPKVCVEIGVFGGSSIYPTASALRYNNAGGIVHAIDPWTTEACLVGYDETDPNFKWWQALDIESIYNHFTGMLKHFKLTNQCKVLRMTSEEASSLFEDESIDILHIDGNHTADVALADVLMFLPKVKKGGYIWFDDVNWESTRKAVDYLSENCEFQEARSVKNACFLFRKP
jgi:predicted O-methyltransferase YrrM